MTTPLDRIGGLVAPARRALESAGHTSLESLDGADHDDLLALHGVGARALERLQAALEERGMSLGGDVPEPQPRDAVVTAGHTGEGAADLKTHPTDVSPAEFIDGLSPQRRVDDGRALLELFDRVTEQPAVMWGPSMIGYGEIHYRYATGREGDTFRVGFSPRKSAVSLYGLQGHPRSEELLGRLGKHRTAVSCVYVNKLADTDPDVLEQLVRHAWTSAPRSC